MTYVVSNHTIDYGLYNPLFVSINDTESYNDIPYPIAYWSMDNADLVTIGGTNYVLDLIDGANGTNVGVTTSQVLQAGQAFQWTGSGQYIDFGVGLFDFTGDFSVSVWIQPESPTSSGGGRIIQNRGTGSNGTQDGWFLRYEESNQDVIFNLESNGVWDAAGTGGTLVDFNETVHIAATFNSSTGTKRVYKNGFLVHQNITAGLVGADFTSGRNSTIGASWVSGPTIAQEFRGYIDEPSVWNIELTEEQIENIYLKGLNGEKLIS